MTDKDPVAPQTRHYTTLWNPVSFRICELELRRSLHGVLASNFSVFRLLYCVPFYSVLCNLVFFCITPTPVSALVHSSTLVTAGIFLLYRFNSIIYNSVFMQIALTTCGIFTSLIARIRAMYKNDIKNRCPVHVKTTMTYSNMPRHKHTKSSILPHISPRNIQVPSIYFCRVFNWVDIILPCCLCFFYLCATIMFGE